MAAIKYEAIAPDGTVLKRATKRGKPYVACVAYLPSYDHDLKLAGEKAKVFGSNWEFACKMVAWGGVYGGERKSYHSDEQIARELANYKAKADEYGSVAEAIEGEVKKAIARVEGLKAAGHYEKWRDGGWCGRSDLAEKLVSSLSAKRHIAKAIRLDAVEK